MPCAGSGRTLADPWQLPGRLQPLPFLLPAGSLAGSNQRRRRGPPRPPLPPPPHDEEEVPEWEEGFGDDGQGTESVLRIDAISRALPSSRVLACGSIPRGIGFRATVRLLNVTYLTNILVMLCLVL